MKLIVEDVIRSYGQDVDEDVRQKVRNYIALLASTGKRREQLVPLAKAYLDEILQPDPRYSGC